MKRKTFTVVVVAVIVGGVIAVSAFRDFNAQSDQRAIDAAVGDVKAVKRAKQKQVTQRKELMNLQGAALQ